MLRTAASYSLPFLIKLLTVEQLPAASAMGALFMKEGKVPENFNADVFVANWTALINNGMGFIFGLFNGEEIVGALGSIIVGDINHGKLVANEAFWFVHPDHRGQGIRLLKAYEDEAKKRGAVFCTMVHLLNLQPEKLGKLYRNRGYHPIETSYLKELT